MKKEQDSTDEIKLDATDIQILRLLQENAKLTVRDIAARVHLSATPIHERIKRLENSGVIRQYVALLDNELVNKGIMVICYVSLNVHNKKTGKEFIEAITKFPEVIECYNVSGEFDFMLKIVASSMKSYRDFYVNDLSGVKGISQFKSIFVMDILKQTHQVI